LTEFLGWPEYFIRREVPTHKGFMDCTFSPVGARPIVLIEAKREGVHFFIPARRRVSRYQLDGPIAKYKPLYAAIEQAHEYAVDRVVRYAIVTNGYSWIVFRAVSDSESPSLARRSHFPY